MDEVLIILLLIFLNGLFSMSEIALISARKSKLASKAKTGSHAARRALSLANEPEKFLSTVQIGITLIGILTGIYSGEALASRWTMLLTAWGIPSAYAGWTGQMSIVIVVTYFTIVLGELVPKRIGLNTADRIALVVAQPMFFLSRLALPFVWLLSRSTRLCAKVLSLKANEVHVTEEEIKSMIQEGTENGEVQAVEQDIMERALVLGDQTVESLMTHRKEIVFLELSMSAKEVEEVLQQDVHAAYPVIDDDPDDVKGMVMVKDLVLKLGKPRFSLQGIMQPPLFFPEKMTVYKALENLRKSTINRALIVDEFGGLQGIISLRDILEGLVGSIQEVNEEPEIVERADKKSWLVSGQCLFYDFLAYFDKEAEYTPDYNTLGGLLLDKLGCIPAVGERLVWKDFRFEVVDMDGNRIDKILVKWTEKRAQ